MEATKDMLEYALKKECNAIGHFSRTPLTDASYETLFKKFERDSQEKILKLNNWIATRKGHFEAIKKLRKELAKL